LAREFPVCCVPNAAFVGFAAAWLWSGVTGG
jgi:hypothetical protein